jgi:geranyl-CoA carboxylase beta subunit
VVQAAAALKKGIPLDEARLKALEQKIIDNFDGQMSVFTTSARLLDDGVIDPRDTREVLAELLSICSVAALRTPQKMQFGVARP